MPGIRCRCRRRRRRQAQIPGGKSFWLDWWVAARVNPTPRRARTQERRLTHQLLQFFLWPNFTPWFCFRPVWFTNTCESMIDIRARAIDVVHSHGQAVEAVGLTFTRPSTVRFESCSTRNNFWNVISLFALSTPFFFELCGTPKKTSALFSGGVNLFRAKIWPF